jgi:hypothetical protein
MAPFHIDSFLYASRDEEDDAVCKYLSLIHLGAELANLETILQKERDTEKKPSGRGKWWKLFNHLTNSKSEKTE